MAKAAVQPQPLDPDTRLLVPVMAPGRGHGRSTVAGLLAAAFAAYGETILLDTTPRFTSRWPQWVTQPVNGLAAVPPNRVARRTRVRAAASTVAVPGARPWQVMTDHLPWHAAPLAVPDQPDAWRQLAGSAAGPPPSRAPPTPSPAP
ncbi:hypothetical protein [Streptomyces sp. URMC 126]|uniref:hypothetical protein n=1 Tax=Streptomyces sp. URMC 126 TaxID=3423401 RepID=UPI003F53804B